MPTELEAFSAEGVAKWVDQLVQTYRLISAFAVHITKTRLYNAHPLNPIFYSKTGVYRGIHFLPILLKHLGEAVLTSTHNLCFEQKYKNIRFFFF